METLQVCDQERALRLSDFIAAPKSRVLESVRGAVDEVARTVVVSFSSEDELVDRGSFYERLVHRPESIRSRRLDGGLAVCVNHNTDDQVAVVDGWSLDTDRRGLAVCRFGASERAEVIFRDVRMGIRRWVSVTYVPHRAELADFEHQGKPVVLITDWEPLEISFVPVPADPSVGVGRSKDIEPGSVTVSTETKDIPTVDVKQVEGAAEKRAQDRVSEIVAIGEQHGLQEMAREALVKGTSAAEFRLEALQALGKARKVTESPEIGMSSKEVQSYNWLRAIRALAFPGDVKMQEAAAFERECSNAAAAKMGRAAKGMMVPWDVARQQRDMIVGTAADGGYLKGTDQRGDLFIDRLANRMMVRQMGATVLDGLVGDCAVPRMTAGHTAYWVDESTDVTESKPTLGQLLLQPKQIGALSDISRLLLLQSSPAADALVKNDLARVLALGVDLSALHGTASNNQPRGIAATVGIGSVAIGTDGGAPTYDHIVSLETEVAQDNADVGALGFLTNAKVRGKLRKTFPNTTGGDTPVWTKGSEAGYGDMLGYRAGVSNQVSSALTKGSSSGVCSAIFFGNWADLVIGMWGGPDLTVDPYTLSAKGWLRVVALQAVDIGIRQAQSFAACLDATTT